MDFTFSDLNAYSLQETTMTEGNGLTHWREGENLVIQVNPKIKVLFARNLILFFVCVNNLHWCVLFSFHNYS